MNVSRYILFFISIFFLNACKRSPKLIFKVASIDSSIIAKKVSISELANNYRKYHGQYIETTGTYFYAFEDFAIHTSKNLFSSESRGFWLNLNPDLNINNTSLEKMNCKQVRVKGVIDTTQKGHLGAYLATVRNIYYWKEE